MMHDKKLQFNVYSESWQLKKPFVIARGARTSTEIVFCSISDGKHTGHGESVPTEHYGESVSSVISDIKSIQNKLVSKNWQEQLQELLPAGAARNAVDCAMWDLFAKQQATTVAELLNFPAPKNVTTVHTISIGTPLEMGEAAKKLKGYDLIKIKLDQIDIIERILAVHENAPQAKLLIDANESWTLNILKDVLLKVENLPIVLIEQPLPADQDQQLLGLNSKIPLAADESCHTQSQLKYLSKIYDVINIKLDKCGGLTAGVALAKESKSYGMDIMVGCMLGTSLSMAPALILATQAKFIDLDAPLLLQDDRAFGLQIKDGCISNLDPLLWGG
ncbi:MAG: dipeptide epimerase [Thalassotalea sp.]|mgnify:CR=1 FL=1|nr:dipeptide epimerase [Thalassotalea sp.]